MLRVASFLRYWQADDVAAILREAHATVAAADLPAELQEAAFGKAVDLLSSGHREIEQAGIIGGGMAIPRGNGR